MNEVDEHRQCQDCQATFATAEELRAHREKFRDLLDRIRTWENQCRAHIEPNIQLDAGLDDLDLELTRHHPALINARVCPFEGCFKDWGDKRRLNVHWETHFVGTEHHCIVCQRPFQTASVFLTHNRHPEAIERHRAYIEDARVAVRREARTNLHTRLIANWDAGRKRGHGDDTLGQEQHVKRVQRPDREINVSVSVNQLEIQAGTSELSIVPAIPSNTSFADPYAPRIFHDFSLGEDILNPSAHPLYMWNMNPMLAQGYDAFTLGVPGDNQVQSSLETIVHQLGGAEASEVL